MEQKSQVIVASSIGAYNRLAPAGFACGPSKSATSFMMKQLSTALGPYRIRSNVLAPGCMFLFLRGIGCMKLTLMIYSISLRDDR